ncbi:hypothetical protein COS66_01405 [Candidatus Berkelbacteria bacterium CG06_land_8_20_14_3_00_43_10]|uniref:Uncharacterized protein n=1 Tax=Candidatus Berkelbacteria bacterium CG10_big_fil_rev_8_21_14_0_10_43_14 TaxID=1974515 RepID=A0A2M6R7T1_9BACT|nr:MAG: hypothetical protein COT79_03970 [Candidatus Berkelbacteria bacterium CG10_big_fil_rev_8_21_14_0_10_43_14]PIU87320.1 MAG: hypothetical protein COS66_01405 [Candidatus Berkelbacteria bacterium CG06_land_8_20_14_3_00_43_10]
MLKYYKTYLILLALIVLIWIFRPWFHGSLIGIYKHPLTFIIPVFIIVYLILFVIRVKKVSLKQSEKSPIVAKSVGRFMSGFVCLSILSMIIFSTESDISHFINSKEINFTSITTLPEIDKLRLLPKQVATRYGADSLQNPQEYLGDSQIVMVDGKQERVFPRLPDGGILYFIKKLNGFVTVDASKLDKKAEIIDQEFKYSEGVGVFDNIYYQLYKQKYWVDFVDQPIYLKDPQTQKWLTVVPYIKYKHFPIRTPYWGGFMTITSDGMITDYAPEAAQTLPLTIGNRVQPKEIARFYAESYGYRNGLLNYWFIHKDQPEIDEVNYGDQPFHISTQEGYKQFVVTRPVGGSYGIFKIFIFDTTTAKAEIIEYDQSSLLTGPVAALDYAQKEFPEIDYNNFFLDEPRPITSKGRLYWLISIVGSNSAGIAKNVVVDAQTTKVTSFQNKQEIEDFINSGKVIATPTTEPTKPTTADIETKIKAIQDQLEQLKSSIQGL